MFIKSEKSELEISLLISNAYRHCSVASAMPLLRFNLTKTKLHHRKYFTRVIYQETYCTTSYWIVEGNFPFLTFKTQLMVIEYL